MRALIAAVLVVALTLAGCGTPAGDGRVVAVRVDGFANETDAYAPASPEVAVVVLHGGGGSKEGMPYQVALSTAPEPRTDAIRWDWLAAHRAVVAFPNGGVRRGTTGSWSNDGDQDDTAFLLALADRLRAEFGVRRVYLTGHSAGAMMASRVWCRPVEPGAGYDAIVPVSGPPTERVAEACPGSGRAVEALIGSQDEAIIAGSAWDSPTWRMFGNRTPAPSFARVLLSEPAALAARARAVCGGVPGEPVVRGATTRWSACDGRVQLVRAEGAQHAVPTIGDALAPGVPTAVLDEVLRFGDAAA